MSNEPVSPLSLGKALGVTQAKASATPIKAKPFSKAEKDLLHSNALEVELHDQFSEMYGEDTEVRAIKPPHNLINLSYCCEQNNTLGQCVAAMEVNIDGTGYEIVPEDEEGTDTEDDSNIDDIRDFFDEPYPGVSLTNFRRQVRRDLEKIGNAYIEVIRNKKGDPVFLNRVPAITVRLVALDDPVPAERKVNRMGTEQIVKIMIRERRFIQSVGEKFVYFKEFGASRDLNKFTGRWVGEGQQVVDGGQATEIIHLTLDKDTLTPYGVPRWINQVPSVLGSRRAEEFNLDFFNSGGLPPAIIFLQGAELDEDSKTSLTNYLAGKAKFKQRALVVSTHAAEGDLGSASNTKITVERFGSERQKDSMFENYDERCAQRVRGAFRIPPLFLGLNEDYNFATAYTTYMTAEAQVFQPERTEFDEMINLTIMPLLKDGYKFRSKPLSVKDVENQIKVLELMGTNGSADPNSMHDTLNEVGGLQVLAKEGLGEEEEEPEMSPTEIMLAQAAQQAAADDQVIEGDDEGKIAKIDDTILRELADDWANHLSGDVDFSEGSIGTMQSLIKSLSPVVRKLFNSYVATRMLPDHSRDPNGLSDLMGCVGECDDH